jgi:ribosomal protein S18 acetylase RimI-like enzyme
VSAVEIVGFRPDYAGHFRTLNVEWLEKYYRVEAIDEAILSNPVQKILEPGGDILFAVLDGAVVGTVALKHDGEGVYEMTKMAVTARAQGLGIGRRLLEACVDRYRQLEGRRLYLESQSRLKPALRLYESAGFEHASRPRPSAYERADVYMVYRGG